MRNPVDAIIALLLVIVFVAIWNVILVRQELANETLFSEMLRLELAYQSRRIPANCAEDVFLQGIGDFDGVQYEAYECGPAMDDFLSARSVP